MEITISELRLGATDWRNFYKIRLKDKKKVKQNSKTIKMLLNDTKWKNSKKNNTMEMDNNNHMCVVNDHDGH